MTDFRVVRKLDAQGNPLCGLFVSHMMEWDAPSCPSSEKCSLTPVVGGVMTSFLWSFLGHMQVFEAV